MKSQLLLILMLSGLALAADTDVPIQETIRAKKIVIHDSKGKPRIFVGTDDDDTALIQLLDSTGQPHVTISAEDGGARVTLNKGAASPRIALVAHEDSAGVLIGKEEANKTASGLGLQMTASGVETLSFTGNGATHVLGIDGAGGPVAAGIFARDITSNPKANKAPSPQKKKRSSVLYEMFYGNEK